MRQGYHGNRRCPARSGRFPVRRLFARGCGLSVRLTAALLCAAALLGLSACGARDPGADRTVRMELDGAPSTIDPLLVSASSELLVAYNVFEGLTRVEQDGSVSLAAAEKYTVDDSRTVYTFTLREDALWSDGEPVRAQDFVFGLRRAVDPVTKARAAFSLDCIENASQIVRGERPVTDLGATAVDDRTLVIRIQQPYDSFLSLMASNMAMPCREDFFNQAAGRYGMTQKTLLCNGPFAVRRWTDRVSMTLIRNGKYHGSHPARSSAVTLQFDKSEEGRIERLNNQETDFGLCSDPAAVSGDSLKLHYDFDTSYALWFSLDHPVLKGVKARAALAGLVNEGLFSNLPGHIRPSEGLIPDGCTVGGLSYRASAGPSARLTLDAAQAKADYAAAAQSKEAKNASAITLLYPDSDAMKAVASRLVQQWQKELGAYVDLKPAPASQLYRTVRSGEFQIALLPLRSGDNSALTLLQSFAGETFSLPSKLDEELDRFLTTAASAQEDAGRAQSIRSAEQWLIDQALAVPVVQTAVCYAARPVVDGVLFSFSSRTLDLSMIGKTSD